MSTSSHRYALLLTTPTGSLLIQSDVSSPSHLQTAFMPSSQISGSAEDDCACAQDGLIAEDEIISADSVRID